MAKRGRLFVVSGPAGAGKSEIVKALLKKHDDVKLSVSCTTRAPRPGEVNGVSYHFVSDERFDELVAQNAFYEWRMCIRTAMERSKASLQRSLTRVTT